jgi:regulator of protease activity HflC (stomatin/prohibitin superfamily)
MKVRLSLMLVLVMSVAVGACSAVTPDPGQEAVLVSKPWFFGHGGTHPTAVKTGRTWVAASTEAYYVPMTPMSFTEHFEDLMTSDGVPLDFDATMQIQITDSVKIVEKFGVGDVGNGSRPYPAWYANTVVQPYRTLVRDAVKKHGLNETAISTTAVKEIDDEISSGLAALFKAAELPLVLRDFTVGRANPPDSIKTQRAETAAQEQRVATEQKRLVAEQTREATERQRARSDRAYQQEMGLSNEHLVALRAIDMQRDVCSKGNCSFVAPGVAYNIAIK